MLSVDAAQQVLLEERISEMQRGTVKQLGIKSISWANGAMTRLVQTTIDQAAGSYTAALGFLGSGVNIEIDALERRGLVYTLAQPNLIALSSETASFLARGEFPVPVSSTTGIVDAPMVTIEFKQFGVGLAFTPTVLEDGLINLFVAPEVSVLDPESAVVMNGFKVPGLKVRHTKTIFELRDGQSFALAGLIKSDFSDSVKAIPILARLPVIGPLFRSTAFSQHETELVIVVTPRIVHPVDGNKLSAPTDRVRPPTDHELFFKGQAERPSTQPAVTHGAPPPVQGGLQ
jgi:pilus assembly protein CpaC